MWCIEVSVWNNVWRGSHTVPHEEAENKEENRVKRELHICKVDVRAQNMELGGQKTGAMEHET